MINDEYYPKINQTTDIYKKINIAYVKETELFDKELELFNKYIHFNKKD